MTGPVVGEECPRCGYVLQTDGTLHGSDRSAKYPCASCQVEPVERDQRFTVQDYLALAPTDRDLVREWLHVHDIDPRDVAEIVLLSPHLVSVVRWSRPLTTDVDGELVTDTLTFQVRLPFPVKAAS